MAKTGPPMRPERSSRQKSSSSGRELGLDADDFLQRNDAYHFFDATGGLFKTGPTQTNVCDLRVVVANSPVR